MNHMATVQEMYGAFSRGDIPAILDMVESVSEQPNVMVELDPSAKQPMTPLETAQTSKAYLQKLGYKFRS